MAGLLTSEVLDEAALLLNDAAKITFGYTVTAPWLRRAVDALSDELAVNGIPLLTKKSVVVPVTGSSTTITCPSDCLIPIKLEERALGSSDIFTEMKEVRSLPTDQSADVALIFWAFQGTLSNSVPVLDTLIATSNREVRITYERFLPESGIVDGSTDLGASFTWQSKRFLAATVAKDVANFVLKDDKRAKNAQNDADLAIYRIKQVWTRKMQNMPIRRGMHDRKSIQPLDFPSSTGAGGSGGGSSATSCASVYYNVDCSPYNAVGDGVTDDSVAFQTAMAAANANGGGIVLVGAKNYIVSQLNFAGMQNVIIQGASSGYSYTDAKTRSNLRVLSGVYGIRFGQGALYCGIKNISLSSNGALSGTLPHVVVTAGVEYGIIIESPATIMEEVTVYGFQHGCVVSSGGNANVIDRCAFLFNTKTGFACLGGTAGAYACYHPNLSVPGDVINSTVFTVTNTQIRRNGWGIILRDGAPHFEDVIVESNWFGGLFAYVGTLDSSVSGVWIRDYFESNFSDYDTTAAYTVTQNNFFQQTTGVWISITTNANTALNEFGYQIFFSSVATGSAAGPSLIDFINNEFHLAGNQKGIYLRSSFLVRFIKNSSTGGDQTNAVRLSNGASLSNATHFIDYNGTLPATFGNRGCSITSERSDVDGVGGLSITPGYFRGLAGNVKFPATQVASSDVNMLDDYEEGTWIPTLGGATSETGQVYSVRQGKYTKIGRVVVAEFYVTLTTVGTITGNATLKGLPFSHTSAITQSGSFGYFIGLGNNVVNIGWRMDPSVTTATLFQLTAAAASVSVCPNTTIQSGANLELAGVLVYETDT